MIIDDLSSQINAFSPLRSDENWLASFRQKRKAMASGLCCGCGKLVSLDDAIPLPHDQRIHVAHGMAVFGRLGSREPPKHWLSSASVAAVPAPSVSSASI